MTSVQTNFFINIETPTYRRYGRNSIPVPHIIPIIDNYRTFLKSMRRISQKDLDHVALGEHVALSLKMDGMHVFGYFRRATPETPEICFLCNSPSHRTWWGLPVIDEFAKNLRNGPYHETLFVGEMFTPHNPETSLRWNARPYVEDVLRVQNEISDGEIWERIGLRIFDLLLVNGTNVGSQSFFRRWEQLLNIFPLNHETRFSLMPTYFIPPVNILQFYNTFIESGGHEGFVIHHLLTERLYKLKPRYTIKATVLGYADSAKENEFAGVLLGIQDGRKNWIYLGQAHTRKRLDLFQEIHALTDSTGPILYAEHQEKDRKPYQWVSPQLVVEVEFQGLRPTSSSRFLLHQKDVWVFEDGHEPLPWQLSYPVVNKVIYNVTGASLYQLDSFFHDEEEDDYFF